MDMVEVDVALVLKVLEVVVEDLEEVDEDFVEVTTSVCKSVTFC